MTKAIEQKVLLFIDENNLLSKGDRLLVALSGGADSVFLLYFLKKFTERFKIELAAFHLNHQLRGRKANQDEKFCTEFCKKNNIEHIRVTKDVKSYAKKNKVSLEEAGRDIRYSEMKKAAKKRKYNKIATAHNASDNVETILLNLFKGTGLQGLSGIPVKRDNIIRPILCLNSDEIREYLKQNKIDHRIDESNLKNDFERNFLRNEIIPKLKSKLNPKLEEKINNSSKIISQINLYIKNQIEQISKKSVITEGRKTRIDLKQISKLDKNFVNVFLKSAVENNFKIELNTDNISSLADLLNSQAGKSIQLKEGIVVSKERGEFVVQKKKKEIKRKIPVKVKVGQKVEIYGKIISIQDVTKKMVKFTRDKKVEFISGEELKNDFEVRKWKAGDKFNPIGMKGTKKVSDFLADEKIPSLHKKDQLVLTNDGKIIWVIGIRIDDRLRIRSDSKKVIKLTVTDI